MANQDNDEFLDEILKQLKFGIALSSKAPYPVFEDSVVGHAFDEAKASLLRWRDRAVSKALTDMVLADDQDYVAEAVRLGQIEELKSLSIMYPTLKDPEQSILKRIAQLRAEE